MKKFWIALFCVFTLLLVSTMAFASAVGNYNVNLDSPAYHANNPFRDYEGECTWYAWGRANEKFGAYVPWVAYASNAKQWAANAINAGWPVDQTPKADSIAVWTSGTTGHVAFVESVSDDYIYLSESNLHGENYAGHQYSEGKIRRSDGYYINTFNRCSNDFYRGLPDYYIHIVSTVSYDFNGGTYGPAKQSKVAGKILNLTTYEPTRGAYKFVHWNDRPDDSGAVYTPGQEWGGDYDLTLYAIWEEATPPRILSKDITASDISPRGFTLTFQAEDNVGIEKCWAIVTPTLEPDWKKRVEGTYDPETKTVTIPVDIERDVGGLSETYKVKCYVNDAAENGPVCISSKQPVSVYLVDINAAGQYKAIRDTRVRVAPRETFNGNSLLSYTVKEGEMKEAFGSIVGPNGKTYYRVDSMAWLLADDVQYAFTFKNLWQSLVNSVSNLVYFFFGQDFYPVKSASEPMILSGNIYSLYKEPLPLFDAPELPELTDPMVIEENEDFSFRILNGSAGYGAYITEYVGAGGHVEIPATLGKMPVVSIGSSAFQGRTGVTAVSIPNSVKEIGSSAFSGCTALTAVVIPEGVTAIGPSAFNNCTALASVQLPGSLKTIGYSAFYSCRALPSIVIPEGVTEIGSSAFRFCSNLTSVQLPNSLKSIGDAAFSATGLTDLAIPDGLTKLGSSAFYGIENVWCHAGTSASRLASKNSSPNCFVSPTCPNYRMKEVVTDEVYTLTVTKYIGTGTETSVPSAVDGVSVTAIGSSAFSGCTALTAVVIPEGVTTIGDSAFNNCTALASVQLPGSLKTIGYSAFYSCRALPSIVIPEGVTEIGSSAFRFCSNLTSVQLPNSLKSIGDAAFSATGLTDLAIPDGLTTLGSAFYGIENVWCHAGTSASRLASQNSSPYCFVSPSAPDYRMKEVVTDEVYSLTVIKYIGTGTETGVPSAVDGVSVTEIGSSAFNGCTALTAVVIPEGVTTIGDSAFNNCTALTSVQLPGSLKTIDYRAFEYCSALPSIVIPEGVTSIGASAFYGCSKLTKVTIPQNSALSSIGNNAFRSTGVTFFGYKYSFIEEYASKNGFPFIAIDSDFGPDFILPAALKIVEEEAFAGGAFTYVQVPESTMKINARAFANCPNLRHILILNEDTILVKDAFAGVSDLTIHGKDGSYAQYFADRYGIKFMITE